MTIAKRTAAAILISAGVILLGVGIAYAGLWAIVGALLIRESIR